MSEVACIDASSGCLVHDDCRNLPQFEECGACLPEDGAWSCGVLAGCTIAC